MKKETNNTIILADFSKDYNAFRWFYSILFTLFSGFCLIIFLIYFLKIVGFNNSELQWIPLFDPEDFPYKESIVDYLGTLLMFLMAVIFSVLGCIYFFNGKIIKVIYLENEKVIRSIRNGAIEKNTELPISKIKYLRKKKGKRSPGYINTGQHHVHTISLQMNRAYAVMKDSHEYVLLFEYYDKKKFDQSFREINKFIKEKKAG